MRSVQVGLLLAAMLLSNRAAADINVEWQNPEGVAIIGYSGSSEDPFISPYLNIMLFDSHSNDTDHIPSYIFQAYRLDYKTFQFLGPVQGVNVPGVIQGAPNMDAQGNFYFQSNGFYMQNLMTSYRGTFNSGIVSNVRPVVGISRHQMYYVTMEAEISADGNTLLYGDFQFDSNLGAQSSRLVMTTKNPDGSFTKIPDSDQILANVNAINSIVYNGILSPDRLEIYFTTLNPLPAGTQMYVAKRNTLTEPFGIAQLILAAGDCVENGSLSLDGKHLYYHRILSATDSQIHVLTRP